VKIGSDVSKPRSPKSRCCSADRWERRGGRSCVWRRGGEKGGRAGLVTAAGTAGGLSCLCQVHSPVPSAAGAGSLGLVLG